jgi:hypothetical protein
MRKLFPKNKEIIISLWIGIFLSGLVFSSMSLAQEKGLPLTNESLLRQTIREVLENCLKEAPFDSKLVWIKEEGENLSAWIVKEELVSYLQKRGPVGFWEKERNEEDALVLNFRVIKLSLEYPEVKTKKLLGRSWVKRESQVALSFNLSDSLGKVLWNKRGESENSDLVRIDELTDLNNKQYPYFSPEVPESSWGKYLEPALVTVAVGALVYLFFANR